MNTLSPSISQDELVSANNAYGPNANDRQQFSLTFKKDRCIRC